MIVKMQLLEPVNTNVPGALLTDRTGTQTWTGRGGGDPVVRGCTVALVRDATTSWD